MSALLVRAAFGFIQLSDELRVDDVPRSRLTDDPARRDLIATTLLHAVNDDEQVQAFHAHSTSEETAAEFVAVTTRLGEGSR